MARQILLISLALISFPLFSPTTAADGYDCELARRNEPRLALRGLDPVLLVSGREETGKKAIHARHGDFTYWFYSDTTRRAFQEDPDRYGVRTQGFCPPAPGLPGHSDIYLVHEGRIYLFFSQSCDHPQAGAARPVPL